MTVEYPFSLAQLAQILSALENERRNPNSKRNAIRAIERNAAQIGLSAEDVFDAADGLLSGRLSAAEFRAQLRDEGCGPASFVTEASTEPAPDDAADEPAEAYIMPNAGPLAVAENNAGSAGADAATDVAASIEDAPVGTTDAVAANPETTGTRVGSEEQLLAACRTVEHWLQAELDRPGETRPDEILRVLRAAIERAQGQPRRAATGRQPEPPRADTKQARLIAMLHRGASISEMTRELGWLRHTCHGALAGLKKKRGLTITSEKGDEGVRVYRIAG
jgi:hypothetical protein